MEAEQHRGKYTRSLPGQARPSPSKQLMYPEAWPAHLSLLASCHLFLSSCLDGGKVLAAALSQLGSCGCESADASQRGLGTLARATWGICRYRWQTLLQQQVRAAVPASKSSAVLQQLNELVGGSNSALCH
jgi:hypothetical protein